MSNTIYRCVFYILKGGSQLYKKFEQLLEETGKTAYQVSKETGVSTSTLTQWKKGAYQPKIDKLIKIAECFGVPVSYFIE